MAKDDDPGLGRSLLVGLGALVAASLVVGVVVSLVALGAAKLTGLGGPSHKAAAPESLYFPSSEPTTSPETYPLPAGPSTSAPAPTDSPSPTDKPTKSRPAKGITLQAYPGKVSPGQRIDLSGVYQRGEGATLRVQRLEAGAWKDFPVTASVSGGIFSTYVTTSRGGVQRFRVVDQGAHRTSNPVRVTVG